MPAKKKPAKKNAAKKPAKKSAKKASSSRPAAASKPAVAAKKALPAASTASLQAGDTAPAFSLPGSDGAVHGLAAGKPTVVYFYPRDDTPGCTTEACDFRDNMARITKTGATVYGVSKDSLKSHDKFKAKYSIPFTLLSDEDLSAHVAYGAWGEKVMYGQKKLGVIRSTYLVDKDGKIAKAWPRVKVAGHVDAVIAAIEAL